MSWFNSLFGFRERCGSVQEMEETKAAFTYNPDTGILTSRGKDREFQAGWFECPSLHELRSKVNLETARQNFPGAITVKEVVADVSQLHTQPENRFSLFQAASQFNCLEFTSQRGKPENGIAIYASDRTQGPACAIACAPGTVVRNYFGMDGDCQTADAQINNLSDSEKVISNTSKNYFRVVAGYTEANDISLKRLNESLDQKTVEDFKANMRIGFQWDTEVTNSAFGMRTYTGPQQLVSQAYASACSVSYSAGSAASWAPLASMVLDASYEALMYGAVLNATKHRGEHGSKKVFLTALGGGVFGNDIEWIANAMKGAFDKLEGIALEVTIVSYGRSEPGFRHLLTA